MVKIKKDVGSGSGRWHVQQRSVLFDLDGTLTDPRVGITRCIQHALRSLGQAAPEECELLWCIGPPLQTTFAKLLGTEDRTLLDAAIVRYRERFATVGLFENTLYAGVPEMLTSLRMKGYRTYVATSKPRVYAERILDHFQLVPLFDGVHGSELDGTRVDKGELIAHLVAVEGLAPKSVIMVGDRQHDMVGGAGCGIPCIGVTYGYGSEEELLNHGAARLAGTPAQVVTEIEALFEEWAPRT
jgi:phosphoglycolate phosphatase